MGNFGFRYRRLAANGGSCGLVLTIRKHFLVTQIRSFLKHEEAVPEYGIRDCQGNDSEALVTGFNLEAVLAMSAAREHPYVSQM
jgi:hypothetical protein